jgi:hypothetical protein
MVINTQEWYGRRGIRFESPAPPLPCSYSRVLGAPSPSGKMDHGKRPLEELLGASRALSPLHPCLHDQG